MIKLFFLGDEKMVKKSFLMALFVIAASEGSLSAQELFQKNNCEEIHICVQEEIYLQQQNKSFVGTIMDGVKHTVHRAYETANGFVYLVGIGTIVYVVYVCYNREKINVDILEHVDLPETLRSCANSNGYISVVTLPGTGGGSFVLPDWFSNMIDAGGDVLRATVASANSQAQGCKEIANAALGVAGEGVNHLKAGGQALGDLAATGFKITSDQLSAIAAAFTRSAADQGIKVLVVIDEAGKAGIDALVQ